MVQWSLTPIVNQICLVVSEEMSFKCVFIKGKIVINIGDVYSAPKRYFCMGLFLSFPGRHIYEYVLFGSYLMFHLGLMEI